MLKCLTLALALLSLPAGHALAQACSTYPNPLTNGTTADANQVMSDFNCAALTGNPVFTGNAIFNADVGIGTNSPSASLTIVSTGNTTAPYVTVLPQNLTQSVNISYNHLFEGGSNGNNSLYIDAQGSGSVDFNAFGGTGYVGIGTNSPSYPLYVNGTAYASGAAGALSDARHKDKILPLTPGSLRIVQSLKPVTFVWKDPRDDGMRGEQIGFIAQDVQKTLPDVVLVEKNAEKTMGIKYTEIIPVLTAAIQEEQEEIVALKAEVETLKRKGQR